MRFRPEGTYQYLIDNYSMEIYKKAKEGLSLLELVKWFKDKYPTNGMTNWKRAIVTIMQANNIPIQK